MTTDEERALAELRRMVAEEEAPAPDSSYGFVRLV